MTTNQDHDTIDICLAVGATSYSLGRFPHQAIQDARVVLDRETLTGPETAAVLDGWRTARTNAVNAEIRRYAGTVR